MKFNFFIVIVLYLFVAISNCDDPKRYKITSRIPRMSRYYGMHITHNTVEDPKRKESVDNRDFINKDNELVHRYVIKLKDETLQSIKDEIGVKDNEKDQKTFENSNITESDMNMDYLIAMNQRTQTIVEGHGFHYVKPIAYLKGVHVVERPSSQVDVDHQMTQSADIEWYEQLYEPRQRVKRSIPAKMNNNNNKNNYYWANGKDNPSGNGAVQEEGHFSAYNVDLYFDDPLWQDQWNLADRDIREGSTRPGYPININVYPVWTQGITGSEVIIGIADDGVQSFHPEFSATPGKYVHDLAWNFNKDNANAEPTNQDRHGTACAGVAAATANNDKCGVGVAYNAKVANLKVLGTGWTSDAEEASALTHACSLQSMYGHYARFVNDSNNKMARDMHQTIQKMARFSSSSSSSSPLVSVYSSSWGPVDDGKHWDGPGRLVQEGMKHCTEQGRHGFGSVYIVAGGNGRENMDTSNYDGYANSRYTMAVSSIGDYGVYVWYSEEGTNLICAMPSSGSGNRAIIAPDLVGYEGYSSNDCDQGFGGTSAAAPQLAGLVALMIEANHRLTWRDVQHIIIRSSRMTRSSGIKWAVNSAGRHHSMSLGFGIPDALEAIRLARAWKDTEGTETASSTHHQPTGMIYTNRDVNPGRMETFTWNYTSPFGNDESLTIRLEHVHVTVVADTPLGNGYLGITLCGPSGVCSVLASEGRGEDKQISWTFQTLRHWDEPIEYVPNMERRPLELYQSIIPKSREERKTWTFRVANLYTYRSRPIHIDRWGIDFYGTLMRKPTLNSE